jgi:hypothetical protein
VIASCTQPAYGVLRDNFDLEYTEYEQHLYPFREIIFVIWVKETSATLEQLGRFYKRMPVLVYQRVRKPRRLRIFERYRNELRFVGKLNVLGILVIGLSGYWYLAGTKYGTTISNGLKALMFAANLDDEYSVREWFQKKGRLIVYVSRTCIE